MAGMVYGPFYTNKATHTGPYYSLSPSGAGQRFSSKEQAEYSSGLGPTGYTGTPSWMSPREQYNIQQTQDLSKQYVSGAQKGLDIQAKGYEDVLGQIKGTQAEATNIYSDLLNNLTDLYQTSAEKQKTAIESGYTSAGDILKDFYGKSREEMEKGLEDITGAYEGAVKILDDLEASGVADPQKRLENMRTFLNQSFQQHLGQIVDLTQRGVLTGSSMPKTKALSESMFKSMVPQVGEQMEKAYTAKQNIAGQRTGLETWKGAGLANVRGNMAGLYEREGTGLAGLETGKATSMSNIEQALASNLGGAQTTAATGKANTLQNYLTPTIAATQGLTNTQAQSAALPETYYSQAMMSLLQNPISGGGSAGLSKLKKPATSLDMTKKVTNFWDKPSYWSMVNP